MVNPPQFDSIEDMDTSGWLADIKKKFLNKQWPDECIRCQEIESMSGISIRLHANQLHESRTRDDYLQIGGVIDNICNSACQTCSPDYSTKIGSLTSKKYIKFDNLEKFWALPQDRITDLDINGGEPSASKNYKKILSNLPKNLKSLRVNTNCSTLIPELKDIQDRGIAVTVTVSFDGVGLVHDYLRWPIEWDKFVHNLMIYRGYRLHELNLWTTISTLNINDLDNIFCFVDKYKFDHSYAILKRPKEIDVRYKNSYTLLAKQRLEKHSDSRIQKLISQVAIDNDNQIEIDRFIKYQDSIRNIKIGNFIDLKPISSNNNFTQG